MDVIHIRILCNATTSKYGVGLSTWARSSAWIERLPSKFEESRKSWDRSPPGPPPFEGWSKETVVINLIYKIVNMAEAINIKFSVLLLNDFKWLSIQ